MTKHGKHCENCFAFGYCPDKGTENECKSEEKNDKMFHFGRTASKRNRILESLIRFVESNKGCDGFALITIDEANRLTDIEKENVQLKSNLNEIAGKEYFLNSLSFEKHNKNDLYTELRLAIFRAKRSLGGLNE